MEGGAVDAGRPDDLTPTRSSSDGSAVDLETAVLRTFSLNSPEGKDAVTKYNKPYVGCVVCTQMHLCKALYSSLVSISFFL